MRIRLGLGAAALSVLAACGSGVPATPSTPAPATPATAPIPSMPATPTTPATPAAQPTPTTPATPATPARPSSDRLALRPLGTVEGAQLGYAEYLPPGYEDGSSRPLLIFLHGVGSNGDGSKRELPRVLDLGIPPLIENDKWPSDRPFVVLMPQHPGDGTCPQPREVDAFLRFALGHYDVDQNRVYLTGLSCGAHGAWDYLAAHGDEFVAAAVLVAGNADRAVALAGCRLGRVPIWAFHGAADDVVPVARVTSPIKVLRSCTDPTPVDLRLTIYPKVGHDSWTRTYDLSAGNEIYDWLLGHHHASPNPSPPAP